MQTPGTQGAAVKTALDDLLRSTVQLPNDESDMLQVRPAFPAPSPAIRARLCAC
jgi:hypothetical protein